MEQNEDIRFNSLIPELSVSNIKTSKTFYKKIGFQIKYEREKDKFCFLQLEENQIMIEENNNNWNTGKLEYPYGRGINISMTISDIEKMYNDLKEKNIQEIPKDNSELELLKNKSKACEEIGIEYEEFLMDENTTMEKLLELIDNMNKKENKF